MIGSLIFANEAKRETRHSYARENFREIFKIIALDRSSPEQYWKLTIKGVIKNHQIQ